MSIPDTPKISAGVLTLAAYVSFVPIGVANVLLGPMLPTLSARWSLDYSQAGALFTAQYVASTCAVALSGTVASRWGFRFAMKVGLSLMAAGLALLLIGPKLVGVLCIGIYGGGIGLAVPAANLLVAEANPERRSATLSLLNFFWSLGAVACPFLVAVAVKTCRVSFFLVGVAVISLAVVTWIAAIRADVHESAAPPESPGSLLTLSRQKAFYVLGALFCLYVGTENGFGGWVASYSKSLGSVSPALSLITPSFFYATLMLGRWLAPFLLRISGDIKLAQSGLLLACAGTAGLLFSRGLTGVLISACSAGLGFSSVYPITIALLSREFGQASARVGSLMFVLSNIGGGLLPWIVGLMSTRFGTLKAGLVVPLLGCATMYALYLRDWGAPRSEKVA